MQSIQNKWFRSVSMFVKNHIPFIFLFAVLLSASACQKNRDERVHIKGRIVTKGTGDPILMAGVKFGIYEAQPSRGFLTPQAHLLIDSFETDANGMFEHAFENTGLIENMSVKQITVVPGYAENTYRYYLKNDLGQFENIHQLKKIIFNFNLDNTSGSESDTFMYAVPGSQITMYVGNSYHSRYLETVAFYPLKIMISNFQTDSQYNIDVYFETLDTARYTFVP